MALPTVLPPGSEPLALSVLTFIYSPAAVGEKLAAATHLLGSASPGSGLEMPSPVQASRVLLENR